MKRTILLLALMAQVLLTYGQQSRPNIIVFLVDDMGWMDTSVPFGDSVMALNKRYHTPNMERLAKEGMKFTNAYATPVCTPTRVSMISGMNAAHHGVTDWVAPVKNNSTDVPDKQMSPSNWNYNGMSPVPGVERTVYATPFPQLLKDAGYFTIHVGKAHWASSGTPGANPYNMGFIVNIAGHAGGSPQSYLAADNYGNWKDKTKPQAVPDLEEYFGSETFLTEALTREAVKALETPIKRKQPFYLNMAQYAVHVPIMADKRFVKKYLDAGYDNIEARYASMIEGMDKSLGDIMDYLKKKGVDKNTVLIFMSDNGGLSEHGRGGTPNTHNLPLKSGKGSVYEGGIREPMIVKWPGVVKPATVAKQYVIIEDFFPTILEIAGVQHFKTVQSIDGKSFLPILKNAAYTNTDRALIWHYPNKWDEKDGPGINYFSAIRKGKWKLVYNMRAGTKELYDLDNDIGEQHDLADAHLVVVKQLADLLTARLEAANAQMPSFADTGKPVPWPSQQTSAVQQ